tara:strand:- start:304 stop:747 length:444 start_codon:yes stop_codon:yes gene_type:complete
MSIKKTTKEFNPFSDKLQSEVQNKKEFFDISKQVVVDHTVGTRGFVQVADLRCTYEDLIHFFGQPMRIVGSDRRVEWGFREIGSDVGCTIYDDNSGKWTEKNTPLENVFEWMVGGHCDRSIEMIGQIFEQEFRSGKTFKSKPIEPKK